MKLNPTPEETGISENLLDEIKDWEYCTSTAVARGIGPLLLKRIELTDKTGKTPENAKAKLKQSYFMTMSRSMVLYEALKSIAVKFNEKNLKFVVLKGAYLSEALYKDPGLRQFSDIDILIEDRKADECLETLRDLGYKTNEKAILHSEFVRKNLDFVHFPPMHKDGISIEVHIKLHQKKHPYKLNIKEILHDAIPVEIQRMPAYALQSDDLLIHLCVHADKHFEEGQVQFTCYNDLTNMLAENQDSINWENFVARCRMHQCEKVVFRHLLLVNRFCNAPIPGEIIKKYSFSMTDKDQEMFIQFLRGQFFKKTENKSSVSLLKNISSFSGKIHFVTDMLFPPKSYMVNRYKIKNPANYRAYYLVRFWEGLKQSLKS